MAETVDTKPAFREAFERRRCLVPVGNFYEWKKTETGKQPCAIALADRGLMALAACGRIGVHDEQQPGAEHLREIAEKIRRLGRQSYIPQIREELSDLVDQLDRMVEIAKRGKGTRDEIPPVR